MADPGYQPHGSVPNRGNVVVGTAVGGVLEASNLGGNT